MEIADELHRAQAIHKNDQLYSFDAIECLVNFLKLHKESDFVSIKVADYAHQGTLIPAKTAYYLQSKAIPSPMGANLSAFAVKEDALKLQSTKGGEIFTWEEIKEKFKASRFGNSQHHHHNHNRPDAHAPIGVMGDHLHTKGGFMLSFRYMLMTMDGNKSGTSNIDNGQIFNNFMVAPQQMDMYMYMLGAMYAPSDRLTIMAMQNFLKKDMDLTAQMMMNGMTMRRNFSTESSGLADLNLAVLYGVFQGAKSSFHLNAGLSIPVGSIKERDDTPMVNNVKLPYAMQLGSGTYDISVGATYKENYATTSWGAQLSNIFRTGKNSEDYRFGNQHQLTVWGAYMLSKNLSISGRFQGVIEQKLKGADPELNPMMVTTANSMNYGGEKIRSFLGFNIAFPQTSGFKDLRIGLETGIPLYENYNGIQMDEAISFNAGIKYSIL